MPVRAFEIVVSLHVVVGNLRGSILLTVIDRLLTYWFQGEIRHRFTFLPPAIAYRIIIGA